MKTQVAVGFIVMMFVLTLPAIAGGKGKIQNYFNDAVIKVKATENASEKREILNESFNSMFNAIEKAQTLGLISEADSKGIDMLKVSLQEKQSELAGKNGFERVTDGQLNSFANYVVQDMEQADEMITISLVAALLIVILLVLIL